MKTVRQLLRQPIKFISGILTISLAVSILSVCLGQAIAADKTEATLEYQFTTIALPTTKYQYVDKEINGIPYKAFSPTLPEEIIAFIGQMVSEHPELVKSVANPGLASAYLPELIADNLTHYKYQNPNLGSQEANAPHKLELRPTYCTTILEIVLEKIGEPQYFPIKGVKEDGTEVSMITSVAIELCGTIQSVVSLEDGYDDPTGRTIYLSVELPSLESLEAFKLKEGNRYLISGYDYLDGNWALRGIISDQLSAAMGTPVELDAIDKGCIVYFTQKELEQNRKDNPYSTEIARYEYLGGTKAGGANAYLSEADLRMIDAVMLTVKDEASFGNYEYIRHENGGYPTMDFSRYITDENGNKVQITEEEWQTCYQIPTITPLNGTVEEFFVTEAGALWQRQMELLEINYHAFPIIGVEKLGNIADFARETARIVNGRDFTAEELGGGAKVCILSESLAAANGLKVGDTINPQFYNYDYDNPNQTFISEGVGVVNPWAYKFANTTEWAGTASYTIIGLYRQDNAWGDVSENLYSFTPNTIFVPHSSVTSDMDYGNQAFFQTLVLHNGTVEQFRTLVDEAGYEGLFVYYDQEYTAIVDTLMNYREIAEKAMIVGIVVYAVILMLFLLLFPGSQGRSLGTMNALGAKRVQRIAQVFFSGASILLPGSVLGCLGGMLLWNNVVSRLSASIGETVTLEMEPLVISAVTLAQLALASLLTAVLALPMSRDKGIRKRK